MTQADPRLLSLRDSLTGMVLRGTGNVSYYLRERIGEGGQGWVFRANWDDPAGHVVIVKVLRPDVIATEALQRFKREAEVLRMLSTQGRPNPYVVRFYDHAVAQVRPPHGGEPIGLAFTVLEFVDGTNLERILEAQKGVGLPAERVRRLLRQICQALDSVHGQKVVHRDLKPSNILLANEGGTEVAKVTDFGLVKLVDVNLQKTTALAGASLGYAPPEQYEQGNRRVSGRTDVFSLAAVVFEMLTGAPAFPFVDGENPYLVLTRVLTGPRPSITKSRGRLAPELAAQPALVEAIDRELSRALSTDPDARHASVLAFWDALEPSLRSAAQAASADLSLIPRSISAFDATVEQPGEGSASRVEVRPAGAEGAVPEGPTAVAAPLRVPESVAQDPASWTWAVLTAPLRPGAVRAATFLPGGETALAVSSSGLLRWERGAWVPTAFPRGAGRGVVRGLVAARDGAFVYFGSAGVAGVLHADGRDEAWPVADADVVFHGGVVDDAGVVTLVGERPYRGEAARSVPGSTVGLMVQIEGGSVTLVADVPATTRLRAVARIDGALVACGDRGALVRMTKGAAFALPPICKGDLFAIAPLDAGAVLVGAGGHALSLTSALAPTLEPVQTTRDVLALATTVDGQAWAGAAQARLLRRAIGPDGKAAWVRMSQDLGTNANLVAVSASVRGVRAIADDGAVVLGSLA